MLMIEDKIATVVNTIKKLGVPNHLGADEETGECSFIWDVINDLSHKKISVHAEEGASKGVFLIDGCDKVIKVPYDGYWESSYDEDEGYDEDFVSFHSANGHNKYFEDDSVWDYCENELEKYKLAVSLGFAEFFPETTFYGYVNDRPIYLQERVKTFYDREDREPSAHAKELYKSNGDKFKVANATWVQLLIDRFGLDKVNAFMDFIKEYDMDGDLHTGNIGFKYDGTPCILDFSGYRD